MSTACFTAALTIGGASVAALRRLDVGSAEFVTEVPDGDASPQFLVGRGVLDDDPPVDGDERVGQLLGLRAFALALWRPMLKTTSPPGS